MRILVFGAGAVGGYFGGRLLEAGRDVTFLVRPRRAALLSRTGLVIKSMYGDATLAAPVMLAQDLRGPFDLLLLACKAYDLEGALAVLAPAVGRNTAILPLLNGMRHLDAIQARFGPGPALGGACFISAALDTEGRVQHLNDKHLIVFGERDGSRSPRIEAIESALRGAKFESRASDAVLLEMWEKWVFLAALAGATCLMRAAISDIVRTAGSEFILDFLEECRTIADRNGFAPRPGSLDWSRGFLTQRDSPVVASMLRDVERGSVTEGEHIIGDLIRRGARDSGTRSLLDLAWKNLQAYDARRAREAAASASA